ncbi:MAG: hypothetical protein J6K16_06300 [Alphaproteobacteria bacterium]|nr:hypothetical protein [Alphaproteobacteria bacterium]
MLWIINGLIYGFFTAIYTIFNQHYKLNAYLLGIWRGFGISFLFLPFCFLFTPQTSAFYWLLLIVQGIMIAVYDSHLFFASAKYGAGPTSRVMALTAMATTIFWWILTPENFKYVINDGTTVITIILLLFGFTVSYWYMIKSPVSYELASYMLPAILSLSGMSIATKEIAMRGSSVGAAVVYYLTVATFVSGVVNSYWYIKQQRPDIKEFFQQVFAPRVTKAGIYIIGFSTALITAKTLALRIAPNPGYVTALLLTAPVFVFFLNKYNKIPDNISIKAGFAMIGFLLALLLLVTGDYGVVD